MFETNLKRMASSSSKDLKPKIPPLQLSKTKSLDEKTMFSFHTQGYSDLETKSHPLSISISELEAPSYSEEIKNLQNTVFSLKRDLDTQTELKERLEPQLKDAVYQRAWDLESQVEQLTSELMEAKQKLNSFKSGSSTDYIDYKLKLTQLREREKHLKVQFDQMQSEKESLKAKATELMSEKENISKEKQKFQDELLELKEQLYQREPKQTQEQTTQCSVSLSLEQVCTYTIAPKFENPSLFKKKLLAPNKNIQNSSEMSFELSKKSGKSTLAQSGENSPVSPKDLSQHIDEQIFIMKNQMENLYSQLENTDALHTPAVNKSIKKLKKKIDTLSTKKALLAAENTQEKLGSRKKPSPYSVKSYDLPLIRSLNLSLLEESQVKNFCSTTEREEAMELRKRIQSLENEKGIVEIIEIQKRLDSEKEKFDKKKDMLREKINKVNERTKQLAEKEKRLNEKQTYLEVREKKQQYHNQAIHEEWLRIDEKRQEVLKSQKQIEEEWKSILEHSGFESLGHISQARDSLKVHESFLDTLKLDLDKNELEPHESQELTTKKQEIEELYRKFKLDKKELNMEKLMLQREKREIEEARRELSCMLPSLKTNMTPK